MLYTTMPTDLPNFSFISDTASEQSLSIETAAAIVDEVTEVLSGDSGDTRLFIFATMFCEGKFSTPN